MAAQPPKPRPPPPVTTSPYPFAAAPDIIRAHQKDAYFQGVLANQLSDLHRRLRGARAAHSWATETRALADALYLCLTTLIGNRTLGEEYCDLVQVEAPSPKPAPSGSALSLTDSKSPEDDGSGGPLLPSLPRRAGYILTSVLIPYLFNRLLPRARTALRKKLHSRLTTIVRQGRDQTRFGQPSTEYRVLRYLLTHLSSLTNAAHLHAVTLAIFYFTGAYYSLSKRIWGLRYVFTRRIDPNAGGRAGYEVLGVLLVIQMVVRGWLHIKQQILGSGAAQQQSEDDDPDFRERGILAPSAMVDVSLDEHALTSNNSLLSPDATAGGGTSGNQRSLAEIGQTTHTPVPKGNRARFDLSLPPADPEKGLVMGWIKGSAQRMCTLCLEGLRDPAATPCGHVFCWRCIGDWVREKPECPLCRREALAQQILPLRAP
ncbi:putative peroxin-10 protein [Thermochaetoides thermophila DSM 1495]|uniref:RING-type E3 ubiquitin transferase n=1 Tax=Chaetomium thermophilum (strain DSM 1495 / CBS 144.50 / IMI 039719) TaxID=759272 RepID=G0SCC5_CHATD|nr:putative peroxin-10 protein [Thermochaetoides thermophila DSM 1495]EGS19051.1 putative peroxin-10 protein [Thermochaetoides thermophila DSM 1495]